MNLAGALYGITAIIASALFLVLSARVGFRTSQPGDMMRPEKQLFAYSIFYLFAVFGALALDRILLG